MNIGSGIFGYFCRFAFLGVVSNSSSKLLVEGSGDPECDAARALLAQGITGKLHLSDAGGFSVKRKRELWGVRYIYTPRPPMPRTIIDIEKAAKLRSVETANGPRFRRHETCAEGSPRPDTDEDEGESRDAPVHTGVR